jgi:hypothetical protein
VGGGDDPAAAQGALRLPLRHHPQRARVRAVDRRAARPAVPRRVHRVRGVPPTCVTTSSATTTFPTTTFATTSAVTTPTSSIATTTSATTPTSPIATTKYITHLLLHRLRQVPPHAAAALHVPVGRRRHPPDRRRAVHLPAGQLPARHLRHQAEGAHARAQGRRRKGQGRAEAGGGAVGHLQAGADGGGARLLAANRLRLRQEERVDRAAYPEDAAFASLGHGTDGARRRTPERRLGGLEARGGQQPASGRPKR